MATNKFNTIEKETVTRTAGNGWTEEKESGAPDWWDTLDDAAELLAGLHPDEVERWLAHFFSQLETKSARIAECKEYGQDVIDTAYLVLKKQRCWHKWS